MDPSTAVHVTYDVMLQGLKYLHEVEVEFKSFLGGFHSNNTHIFEGSKIFVQCKHWDGLGMRLK